MKSQSEMKKKKKKEILENHLNDNPLPKLGV